jgi:hypothetical protein
VPFLIHNDVAKNHENTKLLDSSPVFISAVLKIFVNIFAIFAKHSWQIAILTFSFQPYSKAPLGKQTVFCTTG